MPLLQSVSLVMKQDEWVSQLVVGLTSVFLVYEHLKGANSYVSCTANLLLSRFSSGDPVNASQEFSNLGSC